MFESLIYIVGLGITPFYLASLVVLVAYRLICHLWLKYTHAGYAGLLDVIENVTSDNKSNVNLYIVNVFLNARPTKNVNNFEEFRRAVVNKIKRTYSRGKNDKLKCIIRNFCGLKFWQKETFEAEEQIILFDAANFKEVQDYLSNVANKEIRKKRMFEVHVGCNLIDGKYPLFFRFHHTLGDGYAIRRLILEDQVSQSKNYNSAPKSRQIKKGFWDILTNNVVLTFDVIKMVLNSPAFCLHLYLMGPHDKNSLMPEGNLSGEKTLRWCAAEFRKIKELKEKSKITVTELTFMAVSKSLDDFFKSRGESVPYVTFSFLRRKTQDSSGLANEFLPMTFKVPVRSDNRENSIVQGIRQLDTLPAYKCNFFLPRFALAPYPLEIPDWAYACSEFTGLFSNVPGPGQRVAFEGFEIEEYTFFTSNVPKRNGLGLMCTTYAGNIIYSIIIDRALTRSEKDAQKIVDGMVQYIDEMHDKLLLNA